MRGGKQLWFRWLASGAFALASLALASGFDILPVETGSWGRAEHEELVSGLLCKLGAEPQRDCPVEAAFLDHFGTPLCAYLALPFSEVVDHVKSELVALEFVELRRVHASSVEAYLELEVASMLHLVDYALQPNAQGEHLLLWFIPDFRPPLE